MFKRIKGKPPYLYRAVDHEGEVLEVFATKQRDRRAALKFLKRTMKRYGEPRSILTDRLGLYRAALKMIGNEVCQETDDGSTIEPRTHTSRSDDRKGQWPNSGT